MMSPERMEFGEPNPGVPEDRIAQSIPNVVPTCPSGLAFNRDDFLSPDFSVDGFLSRTMTSGNDIGLERLRDDLGVYLKVSGYYLTYLRNIDCLLQYNHYQFKQFSEIKKQKSLLGFACCDDRAHK